MPADPRPPSAVAVAKAQAMIRDAPDEWGDNSLYDLLHARHRVLLVRRIALALDEVARERDEEIAALKRQYNEQLDRVAKADAATTKIRYESDALLEAKDEEIRKAKVSATGQWPTPLPPGAAYRLLMIADHLDAALAFTPTSLHERAARVNAVVEAARRTAESGGLLPSDPFGLRVALAALDQGEGREGK
jgi:hypothetical protein